MGNEQEPRMIVTYGGGGAGMNDQKVNGLMM